MRAGFLAICLLTSLLAGCAGDPAEPTQDVAPFEDAPEAGNVTVVNQTNAAPEIMVNSTIDGLQAIFNITVLDADNDTVAWTLDANGNGTVDHNGTGPALVNHTYADSGNFTAFLSATDGVNTTNVTLLVVAVAPIPLPPGEEIVVSWTAGSLAPGCLGDIFGVPYQQALDGVAYHSFPLAPHTIGYDYTGTVSSQGLSGGDVGLAFLDADWGTISSSFISSSGEGTIPEGAAFGLFWSCYYVNNTGTFLSTPPA